MNCKLPTTGLNDVDMLEWVWTYEEPADALLDASVNYSVTWARFKKVGLQNTPRGLTFTKQRRKLRAEMKQRRSLLLGAVARIVAYSPELRQRFFEEGLLDELPEIDTPVKTDEREDSSNDV